MKYQKQKGERIKNSRFIGLELLDNSSTNYWFYPCINNWADDYVRPELKKRGCQNWEDCYSLKAAIRKVNKADVPKGTVFILLSRYVGYDIEIIKR